MRQNVEHVYDGCEGGICVKCNRCRHPECCEQTTECHGAWNFIAGLLSNPRK